MGNMDVTWKANGVERQAMKVQLNSAKRDGISLDDAIYMVHEKGREPTILIASRRDITRIRSYSAPTWLSGPDGESVEINDSRIKLIRDDRCKEYGYLIHEERELVVCEEFGDLKELP